jgi:hypothetical protein
MPISPKTWAAVWNAYFEGQLSVAAICAKYQISPKAFRQHREDEAWPDRPKLTSRAANGQFQPAPRPKPLTASAARTLRGELIARLYNAIDLKLTQLERRMSNDDKPTSSADHERESRVITGMARTLENVTELNADLAAQSRRPRSAAAAGKSADAAPADAAANTGGPAANPALATAALAADPASAERLRRDIAQRLERILEKRNPPGDAG